MLSNSLTLAYQHTTPKAPLCYVTTAVCMCRSQKQSYSSGEAWWPSAWCSTPRLHVPNPITGSWCGSCPGARRRPCTTATVVHQSCPRSLKTAGLRGTHWTCTQTDFLFTALVSLHTFMFKGGKKQFVFYFFYFFK